MRQAPHLAFWVSLLIALLLELVAVPDLVSGVRPLWMPLVLAFWALREPRVPVLVAAFVCGVVLDVLFNSVLGQHALATVLIIYGIIKLREVFVLSALWQSTVTLIPVWVVYGFLMFWIDGVTKHNSDPWLRWSPIASTTLFWPVVYLVLDSYVRRRQRRQQEE